METARIIITYLCNRKCDGCCNKDYDRRSIPNWYWDYTLDYESIIITGGEPLLFPDETLAMSRKIHSVDPSMRTILYTAFSSRLSFVLLREFDGVTLTLHEQYDVKDFTKLNDVLVNEFNLYNNELSWITTKSLRLNVFEGVELPNKPYALWNIKTGYKWIKNCLLPKNETLFTFQDGNK